MTETSPQKISTTSLGHALGEASYLDARFLAAQPEYEEMLRWVGIEPSWHVLDAGSGSGAYLPLMCELVGENGSITALDLAPENIQACLDRFATLKPACRVDARVGSLLQLPFASATFDAVWCANTSQYLADAELATALAELKRVTKRGGLVALKEADITCLQFAHIDPAVMWRYLDVARHTDRQHAGLMRAIDLPQWFRDTALINVRAKTVILERFGPLKPMEVIALGDVIEFLVKIAIQSTMLDSDRLIWQQYLQTLRDGRLLDQPEFFIREGAIVVVGEVA